MHALIEWLVVHRVDLLVNLAAAFLFVVIVWLLGIPRWLWRKVRKRSQTSATPAESEILKFREILGAFIRRLEAEWVSERESARYSVDNGRTIMARAVPS